jgi:hypothetical protein
LVDSVFQRDIHIGLEGLQPADAREIVDEIRALECLPPVGGACQLCAGAVVLNITLHQLHHHIQIPLTDIREGELRLLKLRHTQHVLHQFARETDTSRPDNRNLNRHVRLLVITKTGFIVLKITSL